ncbi:protein of unknown function DUF6 transmembrane [Desulfovibrio sp. X2]|uniref:DMT family transporter n=1 Tax=Desulfovibrio sp. X2 TaxID=941449 RepID=UPI0003588723|nr:DMT family transporter [Desulfovibrio sp. X2]EPR43651.1 protein of unknown function DUF6 transmembrane [Desulfovibrio sp. X2]
MRNDVRACADLGAAMVIVGSSVVAGKLALATMPLYLSQALRFGLASLVLVPLLLLREGRFPALAPRGWGVIAALALCGSFLFNVLLLHGLRLTSAAAAGIIASTTPACMGLIAFAFLRQRLGVRAVLGIACSVCGVAVLNVSGLGPGEAAAASGAAAADFGRNLAGSLLVLGAVAAESCFLLLRRALPEELSPLSVATLVSLAGLLFFLPPAIGEISQGLPAPIGLAGWLDVVYYALCITILAYVLWFRGVTRVPPATAAVMTGIMPVSAACLSWLVLGEAVRAEQIAGCLLVCGSILLLAVPSRAKAA